VVTSELVLTHFVITSDTTARSTILLALELQVTYLLNNLKGDEQILNFLLLINWTNSPLSKYVFFVLF